MKDTVSLTEASAEQEHNIGNTQKAFFEEVESLGTQAARGTTVLTDLAKKIVEAACDSLIKPENARSIYERYRSAFQKAGGTPGSIRANACKIRKLIELGNLNDGKKLADDAMRIRSEVTNAKSVLDALYDFARLRLKERRSLTDDEIKTAVTKKPKAPPKPKNTEKPTPDPYKIPWLEIVESKDREGLVAIRDEIDARIRLIDRRIADEEAKRIAVDEAAHAPPAAATPEEEHQEPEE